MRHIVSDYSRTDAVPWRPVAECLECSLFSIGRYVGHMGCYVNKPHSFVVMEALRHQKRNMSTQFLN